MVEKMHFVNIAGPIKDMDTFVIQNVVPHEIQLINAYNILDTVKGIRRFEEPNPYKPLLDKVRKLGQVADIHFDYDENAPVTIMPVNQLEPEIDGYERQLATITHISDSLKEELAYKLQLKKQIEPIQNLEVEVQNFFDFEYMKFRFGSMPKDSFDKLSGYVEELDVIVYEISREGDEVYIIYLTPRSKRWNIDSLFASMYFKRIRISNDIHGFPKDALAQLNEEIEDLSSRVEELDRESRAYVQKNIKRLDELFTFVVQLNSVFDVRNLAVRSNDAFYLNGWIPDSRLTEFRAQVDQIKNVTLLVEAEEAVPLSEPPTKLKNPKFFKPFEGLIKMYGIPSYDEFDPTIFIAITYLLFFGMMFGDVGQGLTISLIGWLLYKKSGNQLGMMAVWLGVSSTIFGFVYGSVFGNEEIIEETFGYHPINPMDIMMEILVITVIFGIFLIIAAMLINMKNIYAKENYGKLLTDRNGIAGLVFYLAVLAAILATVYNVKVSPILVILFIIAPLIVIFMGHPLANYINHKKEIFPEDKGGFIIESVFELIETLLAFLSNTISFLRVGAFALNHVGFFLAFHMLSDIVGESSGTLGSVLVMIFGNVLIIVLEGLIVGIQGMRLTYYELFSRFFEGNGKEFRPFKIYQSESDL